jgi:hypothetical protein
MKLTDKEKLRVIISIVGGPCGYSISSVEIIDDKYGEKPDSKIIISFIHYKVELLRLGLNEYIFSHDFLKRFFEEEWKEHASKLVLCEDRINYIWDNRLEKYKEGELLLGYNIVIR